MADTLLLETATSLVVPSMMPIACIALMLELKLWLK
jgi:hypothetical protein